MGVDVLCERPGDLLAGAQQAGAVRGDVVLADVEALMAACTTRGGDLGPVIAVVDDGLRTPGARHPGVPAATLPQGG